MEPNDKDMLAGQERRGIVVAVLLMSIMPMVAISGLVLSPDPPEPLATIALPAAPRPREAPAAPPPPAPASSREDSGALPSAYPGG